jgi:glyoxalase family protein
MDEVRGIYHVTVVAGDQQRNLNFYEEVLGLQLVKRTVNFADPDTYHLYYGDAAGNPGTTMNYDDLLSLDWRAEWLA